MIQYTRWEWSTLWHLAHPYDTSHSILGCINPTMKLIKQQFGHSQNNIMDSGHFTLHLHSFKSFIWRNISHCSLQNWIKSIFLWLNLNQWNMKLHIWYVSSDLYATNQMNSPLLKPNSPLRHQSTFTVQRHRQWFFDGFITIEGSWSMNSVLFILIIKYPNWFWATNVPNVRKKCSERLYSIDSTKFTMRCVELVVMRQNWAANV